MQLLAIQWGTIGRTLWSIVCALLVFGVIVLVHELGHFFAARWAGVRVKSFAIGMGPAIFKKQGKETLYAIRLFPIGGYCNMVGEDEDSQDSRAFNKQPVYKRFIILAAGAFMNIVCALLVMIVVVAFKPSIPSNKVLGFTENAVSSQYLMKDDQILSIGGFSIIGSGDMEFALLRADIENGTDIVVIRDGQRIKLEDVKFSTESVDGKMYLTRDFGVYAKPKTVGTVLTAAVNDSFSIVKTVVVTIFDLIRGRFGLNEMSGPVGITQVVGQAAQVGFIPLLYLAAFISINLGVMNLLPLPALDGGRLVFLVIEKIRGKPMKTEIEAYVNLAGFALLIVLMVVVTVSDVFKLF